MLHQRARRTKISKLVDTLLREHGVFRPPIDVASIARERGVEVVKVILRENVSGFLARDESPPVIVVHQGHSRTRQRFTIAHELGHYLLHEDATYSYSPRSGVVYRDSRSGEGTIAREVEANHFAAELLMPAGMLQADADGYPLLGEDEVEELADRYDVSPQAMTIRLTNLGLIRPW